MFQWWFHNTENSWLGLCSWLWICVDVLCFFLTLISLVTRAAGLSSRVYIDTYLSSLMRSVSWNFEPYLTSGNTCGGGVTYIVRCTCNMWMGFMEDKWQSRRVRSHAALSCFDWIKMTPDWAFYFSNECNFSQTEQQLRTIRILKILPDQDHLQMSLITTLSNIF